MSTLYMTRGLPASGKSTAARRLIASKPPGEVVRVNRDELRAMLHDGRWVKGETERLVMDVQGAMIETLLRRKVSVVADDTNLTARHETRLRELAARVGAQFALLDFSNVDVEECIRRDAAREKPVGEAVIRSMDAKMRSSLRDRAKAKPSALAPDHYVAPDGLEHVVIFDIDGTLALMTDRSPYDWSRVGDDEPNTAVVDLARTLIAAGRKIVVLSGRDSVCRDDTAAWLDLHVGPGLELHMRPEGDSRKDTLVKKELFDAHIRNHYAVDFVVDDRAQVVRLWRETLGLTCFQVAPGEF